jgi:hypothetical protein
MAKDQKRIDKAWKKEEKGAGDGSASPELEIHSQEDPDAASGKEEGGSSIVDYIGSPSVSVTRIGGSKTKGYNMADESLGHIHHAALYQDWAHSTGGSRDNWAALVARHGDERTAAKNSLWGGTIKTTDEKGVTSNKPIMSDQDKADWQNSSVGSAATAAYSKKMKADRAAYEADPANKKQVENLRDVHNSQDKKQLRSLALTGNPDLPQGKYRPDVEAAFNEMGQGRVSSGKTFQGGPLEEDEDRSKVTEVPDWQTSPGRRHAIGTPDTRPDINVQAHELPAAARHFGVSDSFEHHDALTNHITDMVARSTGGDADSARAGIAGASATPSFHERRTVVNIPTPAEHHANKAMQYLAASAKAQSLGMKDIAVNNFAQATEHAKHVERFAKLTTEAAPAGNTLAALLGGQQVAPSSVSAHLDRYKAAMGVK